ncbi:MAG: hypothetical protein EZS28_029658, partial [Streblomastix strix]
MAQTSLNESWTSGTLSQLQIRKLFLPLGASEVNMQNAPAGEDGGRAIIKFQTSYEAEKAQYVLNEKDIEGITLNVSFQQHRAQQQQQHIQSKQKVKTQEEGEQL